MPADVYMPTGTCGDGFIQDVGIISLAAPGSAAVAARGRPGTGTEAVVEARPVPVAVGETVAPPHFFNLAMLQVVEHFVLHAAFVHAHDLGRGQRDQRVGAEDLGDDLLRVCTAFGKRDDVVGAQGVRVLLECLASRESEKHEGR